MRPTGIRILLAAVLAVSFLSCRPATEMERCAQCGMDLEKYRRTQYEILWTDGTTSKTCGVQCGLTQQLLHIDKFRSAKARDYGSGEIFDARTGYYVFESRTVPDMAPGFIAFRDRSRAEAFGEETGGIVLDLEEALNTWKERNIKR